jgi:hypothetical protein
MRITLMLIACICLITGCAHGRDQQMIDTAKALVPPESSVTEVIDNSEGLPFEVGDYYAYVYFDAGGLTPERLLRVLADRAAEQGWTEEYRCDLLGAEKVGYSRDHLKVDISVRKPGKEADYDASIRVQRLEDGNPWPPASCRLA